MLKKLKAWWQARQRASDVAVLWPECCALTDSEAQARQVFLHHVMLDAAWLSLGTAELVRQVEALRYRDERGQGSAG
jgi:hypothetical protein